MSDTNGPSKDVYPCIHRSTEEKGLNWEGPEASAGPTFHDQSTVLIK